MKRWRLVVHPTGRGKPAFGPRYIEPNLVGSYTPKVTPGQTVNYSLPNDALAKRRLPNDACRLASAHTILPRHTPFYMSVWQASKIKNYSLPNDPFSKLFSADRRRAALLAIPQIPPLPTRHTSLHGGR